MSDPVETDRTDAWADAAAEHLAALVRLPTVSRPDRDEQDAEAFAELPRLLERLYPRLHATLEREVVGPGGLLFRWPGASPDRPIVLMAHWDVVPADADTWQVPPFEGRIDRAAGVVHGRGTLDDKGSMVVVCEAVESLLAEGRAPAHDVYLSFGCDEEVFGTAAEAAVDALAARGVRPWLVIDEGGAVVEGVFPGLQRPAAMIGVAEKGVLDLRIRVEDQPGHAATPRRGGAVARLARALHRIERHPFPVVLTDPSLAMVQTLGRHVTGPLRPLLARAHRARPAVARALAVLGPETSAVVRTTVALTRLSGSPAVNVVAASAEARANIRIQVGETVDGVVARLSRVVRDERVQLEVVSGNDPSPESPSDGPQFALLVRAVEATYPGAVAAPYVMLQASDARHFCRISDHVYRFSPFAMSRAQRDSIHGVDEQVDLDSLGRGVAFYRTLLLHDDGA